MPNRTRTPARSPPWARRTSETNGATVRTRRPSAHLRVRQEQADIGAHPGKQGADGPRARRADVVTGEDMAAPPVPGREVHGVAGGVAIGGEVAHADQDTDAREVAATSAEVIGDERGRGAITTSSYWNSDEIRRRR